MTWTPASHSPPGVRESTDTLVGCARMDERAAGRSFGIPRDQGATVSTIVIGVDESSRSKDAIALGRRLASVSKANVVVASAFPYSDLPSRASNSIYRAALRDDALAVAH